MKKIVSADLFCGAGGTSTGLIEACAELGYESELTAINHWQIAVDTHTANHPESRHLCASLDALNPRDLYSEGELDILWASPECTHHSIARGGKPIVEQSRATAWCVIRWAEALLPKIILVENVKEFESWGPVSMAGARITNRKGEIFQSWVSALRAIGYRVEWRVLCAADYGDPTTRRRLFVYAVRGRRKIVWPNPTHAPIAEIDLLGTRKRWVSAREIIDWSVQGKSIYTRKKPLADKTMRRIMIGLEKFGLKPFICEPFVIGQQSGATPRSVDEPAPTVAAAGAIALVEPYLVKLRGTADAASLDSPSPTVTGGGNHLGLCQPFLVQTNHGNGTDKNGDERRVRDVEKPLPTVAGNRGEFALCEPFILSAGGPEVNAIPVSKPMNTVLTRDHMALCEPFIVGIDHASRSAKPTTDPLSTVTSKQRHALCEPYLVSYYSNGKPISVDETLDTVTTKPRFGLAQPCVVLNGEKYLIDIRFRMLKPHELSRAQGFPIDYKFTGNTTEVVKQIGNAVPKNLAKALVRAALSQQS